jgi:RHS repeat-associated protein
MKRVATAMPKMGAASALAAILVLAPLQPLFAQDSESPVRHAQRLERQPERGREPAPTPGSDVTPQETGNRPNDAKPLPRADEQPGAPIDSNERPAKAPRVNTTGPNDADPTFVSQIQAANKSSRLKADESSGALSYSYPLDVPPGRNGMQPDLTLSYNSQNLEQGSIFGYGWSINIPTIQRKNTNGTDRLYSRFDFTSALSGDLVASDVGNATFSARVDDGANLKYSLDPGQTWTVRNKQGLTYVFGATAAERQDDPADPGRVYTWLLSSISDPNGNAITYTYYKDRGQVYPDKISYGGIFEISFSRAARLDMYRGYRPGFAVTSAYVVSEIQVKVAGSVTKSYVLTYSNNPTTGRSRLKSVAVQDATRTYPPTTFTYQLESAKGFDATYSAASIPVDLKSGVLPVDLNGDGYPDLIKAYEWTYFYYSSEKSVSIYHPESNDWQKDSSWQMPDSLMIDTDGAYLRNIDSGTRFADLNGDLKPDYLRYQNICFICTTDQQVGTGLGWSATPNWFSPINTNGGTRAVLDLNGDGLTDVLGTNGVMPYGSDIQFQTSVSLNNGSDFTAYGRYSSAPPDPSKPFANAPYFLGNFLLVDVNGDGLPDLVKSSYYYGYPNSTWDKKIYLNTGSGWVEDPTWTFPDVCYFCQGSAGQSYNTIYFQDVNNDGYVDFIVPGGINVNNQQLSYSNVYINNGYGWVEDTGWYSLAYFYSDNCFCQNPALFFDGNADGAPDIYVSNGGSVPSTNIFINKNSNQIDLLSTVTLPYGGTISVSYKPSTQYRDDAGHLLNPKLPLLVQTVEKIATDDNNGNVATTTYSYADGSYYYNGPFDHKFAGFGSITETDAAGNVSKSYLHQGNESNQALGEYNDEYCKIGRSYRHELYDSNGHLYSLTINKWDSGDPGSGGRLVKLAQTLEFVFDGNNTHRDKAETYVYDDSTGNLTQKVTWGEVTGNDDGTFTDVGTDAYTTTTTYATNSSWNVVGLPSRETTVDQSSAKVKETKYYYDTFSFGLVGKGNPTRREDWKEGSTYVHTTKTYNDYGLVTQEADPRDNPTTYIYDSYNLYPATVTDALSHATQLLYDYASGKVKQKTDPNGQVFQANYDGLGRVLEEKEPDPSISSATSDTPFAGGLKKRPQAVPIISNLVTKSSYTYTDIGFGSSVKRTDYLDGTLSTASYAYFDGLGRVIQLRKRAEAANTYSVRDYVYNNRGLLQKESLPYFSTGSAKTTPSGAGTLYTSYTHDALQRVVTTTTAVGTTTNTYDDWKLTVTDANGKAKNLYKDAYDRLVQVDEHKGASTYTTKYEYNGLNKLLKITDANNNVRSFTYDGLGRRLTAEDLHAPGDTTFGIWTYGYDDAGNLTSRLDPNGQTCNYKYDNINRVMTEDFAGQQGVEVTYSYDNCSNGVGRLCSVTTNSLRQSNTYNPLGLLTTEDKTIDSVNYHTEYGYDRQGNQTKIVNPDGSQVIYKYNVAGLVDQVSADSQTVVQNVDYSPLGQITLMQYGNGAVTTNTYDPTKLYRLQHKVTSLPGGAAQSAVAKGKAGTRISILSASIVAQDLTYSYDNVGNVLSIVDASNTDAKKTVTYGYDDLYRLTSATTSGAAQGWDYAHAYSYDAVGNMVTVTKSGQGTFTYSYQGNAGTSLANPHAVTSIANNSFQTIYQYDKNGNLTANNLGLLNRWDYNNRLSQSIVGESVTTYAYDQNGQRVKYSNGFYTAVYPSKYYNVSKTRTVVRQGAPAADNAVKHIFIGSQLVATVKGSLHPSVYAVHADHLTGSNVVSNAGGQIEEVMDYFPFGDMRLDQNRGTFTEQRKFAGHEFDYDTGLTYMDARYYNSSSGRFLSLDPVFLDMSANLSDPQALNSYSYARNNPLRYIDPDGGSWRDYAAVVGGYSVGLVQGAWSGAVGTYNMIRHPVQFVENTAQTYVEGAKAGADLAVSLYRNPRQTAGEIGQGIGITARQIDEQFQSESSYEKGKTVGNIFGQVEFSIIQGKTVEKVGTSIKVKNINSVVDAGGDLGVLGRNGVITKTTATKELRSGLNLLRGDGTTSTIKGVVDYTKLGMEGYQSLDSKSGQKQKQH